MPLLVDVDHALKELTIEEKVKLLSGKDNWSTYPIERLNIPSLTVRVVMLKPKMACKAYFRLTGYRWSTRGARHVFLQWRKPSPSQQPAKMIQLICVSRSVLCFRQQRRWGRPLIPG